MYKWYLYYKCFAFCCTMTILQKNVSATTPLLKLLSFLCMSIFFLLFLHASFLFLHASFHPLTRILLLSPFVSSSVLSPTYTYPSSFSFCFFICPFTHLHVSFFFLLLFLHPSFHPLTHILLLSPFVSSPVFLPTYTYPSFSFCFCICPFTHLHVSIL